ncbi:MAG TPA: ferric reductase-like transmembrane domain-containing protein [Solirubrobacteraceae bacterium]|nr:ferric reductase-like transmembrane domain-containing protein [Solirubrobacteraceae bacterium]
MITATSVAPHLFWITSRAAGIVSLVLASLTVSVGLAMSLKMMRSRRTDMLALHEVLSLGTLVALAVHGVSLLGDSYLRPSIADLSVPFVSGYETAWTSIGIIGGWALVILGLSYYARHAIGVNRWRTLHRLTALAWIAGIVHALGEGTDAGQIWFLAMLAIVAVPAVALLGVRYLTDEAAPRPTAGSEDFEPPRPPAGAGAGRTAATGASGALQPRRMADDHVRELPAAPRPAGPALG